MYIFSSVIVKRFCIIVDQIQIKLGFFAETKYKPEYQNCWFGSMPKTVFPIPFFHHTEMINCNVNFQKLMLFFHICTLLSCELMAERSLLTISGFVLDENFQRNALSYFWNTNIYIVLFVFHFVLLYFFP